ncbi:MAG TPA: MFS transporter [Methylomirabilota bacterium]|nr:MFS transporter [Methylomirabilota bacterium]
MTAGRRAGRRAGPAPLLLLTALAFLVQVDVRLMTPLLPSMAESLRTSIAAMGLAMTLYMLPYGLCQLVYGPLADRLGRIPVVRLAAIGFAAGSLLTGQARHVLVLDAVRFLTGMFAAAVIPLTLAHIGASVPYGARQATIGRFAAITSVAQGLSAAIGGTIAHFVSWRVLFTGAGLVALAPALLLFRAEREVVEPAAARGVGRYRVVLRHRTARALYLLVGLEGLFLWGGFTYLGAVAVARFGLNALEVGLLLSLYGAATLAGGISLASIRARVGERPLAAVGAALKGGGYLLMIVPGPIAVFAAAIAMLGFGYIALHTTLQTRATEIVPAARGTAVALFAFWLFMGGAIGAALFGPLVDAGWHRTFLAICGVSLLGLGALAVRLLAVPPDGC